MAERIVEMQQATGYWNGNYTDTPLTTAWMVITLRPALFKAAPIACFTAHPNPSYADQPVSFDPSCSGHSETGKDITNLTLFEWDWNNDGVYDENSPDPDVMTHSFSCASLPCTYPVTLKVTDDADPALTATYKLDIKITNPPHPPVAKAGGPYVTTTLAADSVTLDGSASYDPDEGEHQAGCGACPNDTITSWKWDYYGAPWDFTDGSGETVTVHYAVAGVYDIGLRVADNTLLSYPASGQPNLTDDNYGKVTVYPGCVANLAARPKSGKVQLTWPANTDPVTYDIYRSTLGPNVGFELIATGHTTTYCTYLDSTVVNGTTYYYRVLRVDATGNKCGSKAASAKPVGR